MSFSFPSSSSSYDSDYPSSSSSSSSSSGPSSSYFSKFTSSFGSSDVSSSKDFLESNTLIAKTAFLLLVIILFFILLRICIALLSWLLAPSQNMTLLNGMADATLPIVITQDPTSTTSMPIIRSTNQIFGMEFTWSIWMFIKPVQPSTTSAMQHVFSKGAGAMGTCAKNLFSNNAPGLYLMDTNTLYILMDTVNQPACFPGMSNDIVITNMPINKWFNVVIRLTNDTLDVYINGRLTKRLVMTSVPNQNYDDVYICSGGGFNGYVSDLKYFNSSIGTTQINALVSNGPNTSINSSNLKNNIPPYLSIDWYDENQNSSA